MRNRDRNQNNNDGDRLDDAVQKAGDALGAPQEETEHVKEAAHKAVDAGLPEPIIEAEMEDIAEHAKRARGTRGDAQGRTRRDSGDDFSNDGAAGSKDYDPAARRRGRQL